MAWVWHGLTWLWRGLAWVWRGLAGYGVVWLGTHAGHEQSQNFGRSQTTPYPGRPHHTQPGNGKPRPGHAKPRLGHGKLRPSHAKARPGHAKTQAKPRQTQARFSHRFPLCPKFGPQILVPNLCPKFGLQIWARNLGPKFGDPNLGLQIWAHGALGPWAQEPFGPMENFGGLAQGGQASEA